MFALGLNIVDLVFLFLNHLLISFFQVFNSVFEQLIFFEKFLIFLFFSLQRLSLLIQLVVFLLKLDKLILTNIGVLDLENIVVFLSFSLELFL